MRDTHELVLLDMKHKGIINPSVDFEITSELLDVFNDTYVRLSNTRGKQKDREARYNRKLAALSFVKFKAENKLNVPEGFVYIISNAAWPSYYKIGMSQNPKLRLSQYQTYSPKRDYKLHHWSFWSDKADGERLVHKMYESTLDHEWIYLDTEDLNSHLETINSHCFLGG